MRWFLAMLLVAFVHPLQAQEDEAAKLFQDFEKKFTGAKAYRVTFQVDSKVRKKPFTVKGDLLVAGDKLRSTMEGKEDNTNTMKIFHSDSKNFEYTWRKLDTGKGLIFPGKIMPGFGKTVTWISARMGMQFNLSYLEGPAAGMGGGGVAFFSKNQADRFQAGRQRDSS